jgi:pimeloyl-ACP methyl ester carboxylesterase
VANKPIHLTRIETPPATGEFLFGRGYDDNAIAATRLINFYQGSTNMKLLRTIIVLGILSIGLSACVATAQSAIEPTAAASPTAPATSTPEVTPTATAAAQRTSSIKLGNCSIGFTRAKCGTYRVYENRSTMSGRQINLKIAVLPATGSAATGDRVEPDPLFYFAGGPGGAATAVAPMLKTELAELNKTRDIVLIDQRGTGGSNLLMCPTPEKPFDVTDAEALSAYAQSCLKGLDADPRWYTTRAYVDDVNEVRQALGYDKINISGGSYGGTVVQVYLQQHPETVRTALINNSTLIDYPIFEHIADSSQRAFDLVMARCAKDEKCHAAFPDPKADLDAAFAHLEKQPVETTVWDPAISQPISVTPAILAGVIHEMLMGADSAAKLPRLLHRAVTQDDWDAVAEVYLNRILPQQRASAGLVMYAVIRCSEPWAMGRVAEVERNGQQSYTGQISLEQAKSIAQTCALLPKSEPAALYGPTQKSDVPVLVLNAEEDPQNPPENVAKTAEVYPNSKVLFEPYRGHYTVNWVCLAKVYQEFIELGNVNDLKADCLSKVRPYAFDVRP